MAAGTWRVKAGLVVLTSAALVGHPQRVWAQSSVNYAYDALGRLTTVTSSEDVTSRYAYDRVGNRTRYEIGGTEPNLWANPENASLWGLIGASQSAAGVIAGHNAFQLTVLANGVVGLVAGPVLTMAQNGRATHSISINATSSANQTYVGIYSNSNAWGTAAGSTAKIISGPGTITQHVGGVWLVTGLSTTEPTRVQIIRSAVTSEVLYPLDYVRYGDVDAVAGTSLIFSNPRFQVTYGAVQSPSPPSAVTDSATVAQSTGSITIPVLANDIGQDLSLISVGAPSNSGGTTTYGSRDVTFMPASGFIGSTSFTYTMNDEYGGMATGTANVTVTPQSSWEAETLPHQTGLADGDGWAGGTVGTPAGFLTYGPYTTTIPAGSYHAQWRMMVRSYPPYNTDLVVYLDVYDATADQLLATRNVLRNEAILNAPYELFEVPFTMDASRLGHAIEFRTYFYTRQVYVNVDRVGYR